MAEILFPALFVLLALGLPVAFAMAISVFVALSFGSSYPNLVVVKEMFSGLDSFPLLAVPFFILAAEIMTGGAVTLAMLRLAQSLVGHLKGVLPGVLIPLAVLVANARVSHKRGYASGAPMPPLAEIARIALYALPALMLVVLIVGGIRFGVFTPTEASVIAVFYALFVGMFIYRSLHVADLPAIILRAALVSGAVLLNALLLVFGLFMDPLPGVMILVPILAPISFALGIDPDHFAIIVIVNLTLGLTTPPVGSLIFVVSSAVNIKPSALIKEMPPFFIALMGALLLITFIPALSTWLPTLSGF